MQTTEPVITQINQGIISIQFNRVDKKNALTNEMYDACTEALRELDNNDELRVGFITGSADCFTAGNDLVDFLNNPPEVSDSPVGRFLDQIATQKKPLVAAVNGPAVGVGTTMLLHCELVIAGENARFQLPFVNLGTCPEAGSSLLLPALMGYQRAARLLMLGETFSAREALQWGLVNEVLPDDQYQTKAYELAERLAQQPASSLRITKALMRQAQAESLKSIMAAEGQHFTNMLRAPEAKEAISAFMEKRKPNFAQFK